MDPSTLNHLGVIRQQEILAAAAQDRRTPVLRPLVTWLGRLMIVTGEKLLTTAQPAFVDTVVAPVDLRETEAC